MPKSLEAALVKMTHDLRTPLSVVHTTTSMLLNPKYSFTPEQVREHLERVKRNADVLNHLVDELAELVRPAGDGTVAPR